MEPSIVATLALQYGPKIAEALWNTLTSAENFNAKMEKATKLIELGSSTVDALKRAFGPEIYDKAVRTVISKLEGGSISFDYEAGIEAYVRINPEKSLRKSSIEALREELNINLERVAIQMAASKVTANNYFIGMMREWERRHNDILGSNEDSTQTFAAISSLLDGRDRTYKEVLLVLQKTALGFTGAVLLIYSVLLAIGGIGTVGLIGWLSALIGGPPLAIIFATGAAGAISLALSRIKFHSLDARSTCVRMAYALIDRASRSKNDDAK